MAKKKTHIDELFREGLSNLQQPLNGTEWDKLAGALGQQPRKKRFLWWWFVLPALVVSGTIWGWLHMRNTAKGNRLQTAESSELFSQSQSLNSIPLSERTTAASTRVHEASDRGSTSDPSTSYSSERGGVKKRSTKKANAGPSTETSILDDSTHRMRNWIAELLPKQIKGIGTLNYVLPTISQLILQMDWKAERDSSHHRPIHPYIGIQVGGLSQSQRLSSSVPQYVSMREGNESNRLTSSFGVTLGTDWRGLDVESGLLFGTKGSQLNPSFTYQVYDSILYIPTSGDSVWIPWNYRDTTISHRFKNPSYQYIGIPWAIGKSINLNTNSSLELGLNGQVQFLVGTSGTSIDTALNIHHLNRSTYQFVQLTAGGYVGYRRTLNTKMDMAIRLNWNSDLMDMTKNTTTTQHFGTTALTFTIRRKL
ncbi:MAG: hypothetical protein H6608_05700 [Flavobacteriales bacterium]|nr:hypothetical protein [Bacteroidota bacterium]MCB9240601.1 hypothetical protein [Flavobacteriales bacterium]